MYAKVWNYLRGTVQFQCESPAPERVLNLCAAHEIPFWDVRWETAERFTLRTTREGAAQLEMVAVLRALQSFPCNFRHPQVQ